jgi:hypothetical protein
MSIDQSVFPDKLKKAQVTPLYKKNDPLLSIFSYILSYSGEKIIKVIGYFFLIIYKLVRFIKHNLLFSTGPLFEKNGLINMLQLNLDIKEKHHYHV